VEFIGLQAGDLSMGGQSINRKLRAPTSYNRFWWLKRVFNKGEGSEENLRVEVSSYGHGAKKWT